MAEYSLSFGAQLLEAADTIELGRDANEDEQRAVLYLSLLSCEITLKAVLETAGYPIPQIRKHSHDLSALLHKVSGCEVLRGNRWVPAACIRGIVADRRFSDATVGRLLSAESHGASKYPNSVRYGNSVRHFPADVVREASKTIRQWAEQHTCIRK